MPIDTSMYKNSVQFDPMAAYAKGLSMKQMSNQSKLQEQTMEQNQAAMAEDKAMKNAYRQNMATGPDGKPTLDQNKYLSDMANINPEKAMQQQQAFKKQGQDDQAAKLDNYLKHLQVGGQILGSVGDQQSWDSARSELIGQGLLDEKNLPSHYDPKIVNSLMARTMSAKDRLEQQNKDRDFGLKQQELGIKRQEAGVKSQAAKAKQGKMSLNQSKQLGLYESGILAEEQYNKAVGKKGIDSFDPTSSFQWIDKNDWAPNALKSSEAVEVRGAQDRWVESFLRDASGAAIPPSERGAYIKDFFPVAGDSEQSVKDKAAARQVKMNNAKVSSGSRVYHTDFDKMSDEQLDALYSQHGGE